MAIGDIGCSLTDQLEIDACGITANTQTDTCHATGNWFVTAYHESSSSNVVMVSYEVDTCGTIPCAIQDSVSLSTQGGGAGSIGLLKIADGLVALCYHNSTNGPQVETWAVDSCGNFACAATDTQDLNACVSSTSVNNGIYPTKWSDVFMCTFIEPSGDGQLATVTIDGCGTITLVEKLEFDCNTSGASKISCAYTGQGDYHIVVYEDTTTDDGFADTFTIDACGNIGCEADSHEWNIGNGSQASVALTQTAGTVVIVYGDTGASADATTVDVDACGVMANNSTLSFGSNTSDTTDILPLDPDGANEYFLTVMNGRFDSIKVDSCGVITTHDSLISIGEVNQNGSLALHPGVEGDSGIVVGAGYQITGARLWVFSLSVGVGSAAAADNAYNVAPQIMKSLYF